MSEVVSWLAQPLTSEMRAAHFAEAKSFAGEMARTGRAYRRTGLIVGVSGAVMAVAATLGAAWAFSRPISPPRFFEVDKSTGWIGETVGPADAPKLFNERVTESVLRSYVEDREAFVPETDDLAFHRVAIQSVPTEQASYALAHDPRRSPATAPFVVFGRGGFARVDNFHFQNRGVDAASKTQDYVVHFYKTEAKGGVLSIPRPWTAEVRFQFHPEQPMSQSDRLLNVAGLQVVSYSAYPDSEAAKP